MPRECSLGGDVLGLADAGPFLPAAWGPEAGGFPWDQAEGVRRDPVWEEGARQKGMEVRVSGLTCASCLARPSLCPSWFQWHHCQMESLSQVSEYCWGLGGCKFFPLSKERAVVL